MADVTTPGPDPRQASATLELDSSNAAAPGIPRYLAMILDRAAMLMHSQFALSQVVDLDWYEEGDRRTYRARSSWLDGDAAPRLVVFDARTGDMVCRSVVGDWFSADKTTWQHVCADDDEAREAFWRRASRCGVAP